MECTKSSDLIKCSFGVKRSMLRMNILPLSTLNLALACSSKIYLLSELCAKGRLEINYCFHLGAQLSVTATGELIHTCYQ